MNILRAAIISATALFAGPASADWFSKIDSGNQLLVMGNAIDHQEVISMVYLQCHGDGLKMTMESRHSDQDLEGYDDVTANIWYTDTKGPHNIEVKVSPVLSPSNIVSFEVNLDKAQSKDLVFALSRGERISYRLVGAELIHEVAPYNIYSMGGIFAAIALSEACRFDK